MRKHLPLTAILGVAAIARFWAIRFCLPALECRPDEEAVASIAGGFFARDFNPHFFDWPPLFMYVVALAMVPLFKYAKYTGWIRSEYRFLLSITQHPAPVFLAARAISAAAGTASVWIVHRIALRLFDRTTGLIAAAFLAVAFLHVRDSHFGVTDVAATFLALIALLSCSRLAGGPTTRELIVAGVFTGLAASTKYNCVMVSLPVLWIIATNPERRSVSALFRQALAYAGVAAGVFLLCCPYTLIEFEAFLRALDAVSTHLLGGHGPNVGRGWQVHLNSSLRHGVGLPGLVAGLTGLAWFAWRSPRLGIMLLLFPVATFAAIGSGLTVFARYAVPIVPFLSLGAAHATVEATRALATWLHRPQWHASLAWLAAIVLLLPSARSVWQFDRLLAVDDSRVAAAHWIEDHFPAGATIGEAELRWSHLSFETADGSTAGMFQTMLLTPDTPDPDVIVITESPLHPGGLPLEIAPERLARYERAMVTAGPERPGSIYDWQDEFYIPLAGIDHLDRPGPRITLLTKR